ncbi:MAG: thioredoxin-dependent thiol peroxidase [Bacteroidetes bacterium]|nr:thioredoxin-dependent thiol peroxidase [Bacteroidota bacterium]MDA0879117.1 thioredoxin-dependent thiol peroxidase [Bacteroidota bacterium]MDA1115581.1 thioredoxin-dependent thiol peroxidase [Bacteroidota bacterium]
MNMLQVGNPLPEISVNDESGKSVNLADFIGRKLVVFFYPKANTPGCTAEACDLRDHYKELQDAGYQILGVSADTEKAQASFKNKFNFPYPLLADVDKQLINAFGVWGEKKFMGKTYDGIHRTTFVFDEKGKVERVITQVKTKEHATQILEG